MALPERLLPTGDDEPLFQASLPLPDVPASFTIELPCDLPPDELGPITDFLVYYKVSGLMLVHAAGAGEASQMAATALQAVLERTGKSQPNSEETHQVALGDTTVAIESAEALGWPQELPNPPKDEN